MVVVVNRTIDEQARERATEIRATTIWNGRGTADLLDGLADEIERLRAALTEIGRLDGGHATVAAAMARGALRE